MAKLGGSQNDTRRATAQTSVISLSLFILSDNHSYDHGSVNAATLPRHKPTYTCPHTMGVLSSTMSYNLWARAIAMPADLANLPDTNRLFFTRDDSCLPSQYLHIFFHVHVLTKHYSIMDGMMYTE